MSRRKLFPEKYYVARTMSAPFRFMVYARESQDDGFRGKPVWKGDRYQDALDQMRLANDRLRAEKAAEFIAAREAEYRDRDRKATAAAFPTRRCWHYDGQGMRMGDDPWPTPYCWTLKEFIAPDKICPSCILFRTDAPMPVPQPARRPVGNKSRRTA